MVSASHGRIDHKLTAAAVHTILVSANPSKIVFSASLCASIDGGLKEMFNMMGMFTLRHAASATGVLFGAAAISNVLAQPYPTKPVRIVVPFEIGRAHV